MHVCQVVLASSQTFAAFSGSAPAVSLVYPVRCRPAAAGLNVGRFTRFKDPNPPGCLVEMEDLSVSNGFSIRLDFQDF